MNFNSHKNPRHMPRILLLVMFFVRNVDADAALNPSRIFSLSRLILEIMKICGMKVGIMV